jgi:hypothetical protein
MTTAATVNQLSARVQRQVQHLVYVRHLADGTVSPYYFSDGWQVDPRLRCDSIRMEAGKRVAVAEIAYIPPTGGDLSAESIVAQYHWDDQVKVVALPHPDELTQQPADVSLEDAGTTLFIGRLSRPRIDIQAEGRSNIERVNFTAFAMPILDNKISDHVITGRWVSAADHGVSIVETYELPAVFNFRGRGNMAVEPRVYTRIVPANRAFAQARVFTYDGDPLGQTWSFREALASLICVWLFGAGNGKQLDRSFNLDLDTWDAIFTGSSDERFEGLSNPMPEINVHGMGILDAMDAVLAAAGFDWAISIADDLDKPYGQRIWKRNTGPLVSLALDKRGTSYAAAEDALRRNQTNKLNLVLDGSEIRNEIIAIGRTRVEATFNLKPLWYQADTPADTITTALQSATSAQLNGSDYWAKHITGGRLHHLYSTVGRRWGLHHGSTPAYSSGVYAGGSNVDFVQLLLLNISGNVRAERVRRGQTDPITWLSRPRRALPCRHPELVARGWEYVLEVSEDSGQTWSICHCKFTTLSDCLGVVLSIDNIASVNNATWGTQEVPSPTASWLYLLRGTALRFRLTCSIEADHAPLFRAQRAATSGSRYRTAQVMLEDVEEIWIAGAHYVPRIDYQILVGDTLFNGQTWDSPVRTAAERRRDALEDGSVRGVVMCPQMDWSRWRIGQRVSGIIGRELAFDVSSGGAARYPNIVGIRYALHPAQGIELDLDDQTLAAGR